MSTSEGLTACDSPLTHPSAKCGGSQESPGVSPLVLEGSVQGDLFYRNVPRDRLPASLHSRAAPEYLGKSFEPFEWMEYEGRKCRLPSYSDFHGVYALEKGISIFHTVGVGQCRSFLVSVKMPGMRSVEQKL